MFLVLELQLLICYDIFMLSFSSLLLLSGVSEGHPGSLSASVSPQDSVHEIFSHQPVAPATLELESLR